MPFILLHDWDSSRVQMHKFSLFLQSRGHAVIIPDLRGHGQSVEVVGSDKTLDYTKFRKSDVAFAMRDIERCKKYLVKRHNEGKLNIDMLCVGAIGETCVLAVEWAMNDWFAFPSHNAEGFKQGQDVKTLLLISPEKRLAGVSMMKNLRHPMFTGANGGAMPLLIMWNTSEDAAKDSESIFKTLDKARPDVAKIKDKEKRAAMTTLFSVPVTKSALPGAELIENNKLAGLWNYVEQTISNKMDANKANYPWKTREKKKKKN